jgi:hypothetical protein
VLCLTVLASSAGPRPKPAAPILTVWQEAGLRCRHYARERLASYPWPVAPFHRQHPVRGNFGDPRTVFTGPGEGAFSFHNGVDVSAPAGALVYPVVSGAVARVTADLVVVRTVDARRFQFVHLAPLVHPGEQAIASKTVLGTVRPRWNHVHLSEIRQDCAVNPLMPGHLTPYRDTTRPTVRAILFQSPGRHPLSPAALSGKVRILADAFDTPALASPPPWSALPVAPLRVTWRIGAAGGRIVMRSTGADFRYSEPFRQQFCSVYAPGTRQNFAVLAGRHHRGEAGRYLFDLTPGLLDTTRLPAGRYRVTVTAFDTGGNRGSRTELVQVKHGPARPVPVPRDGRCTGRPPSTALVVKEAPVPLPATGRR